MYTILKLLSIRLHLVYTLLVSAMASGQTLPDSIVLIQNTYVNDFSGGDKFYGTWSYPIIKKGNKYYQNDGKINQSKILRLISEVNKRTTGKNTLASYDIDTTWVKNNPNDLLALSSKNTSFLWNEKQKQFIFKELTNLDNYTKVLGEYLAIGCCYRTHQFYKHEFILKFYKESRITQEIKSRRHIGGYKLPWTNQFGDTLYDFAIERSLDNIAERKRQNKEPLKGKKLLRYLVAEIIDANRLYLYRLAPYSYIEEIEELKSDFKIESFEEVYGFGRYISNEPKTIKIVLKNNLMLDNVYLNFLASVQGASIYSRDSLKQAYSEYIKKIQAIHFIVNYLKANPSTRLDIYFFNNNGINEHNMDGLNKTPEEWKEHDDYVETSKSLEKSGIRSNSETLKSIKISEKLYCGCNYRFERSYIEKAIFFEIKDLNGSSIWFLLPDDKVLLYVMEGSKVLNFDRSEFEDKTGLIYPCLLFDLNGRRLAK